MPNGMRSPVINPLDDQCKGCGIRIKNPLSLAVRVKIKDGVGFDITRTVKPGQEIHVPVPHSGDYDVETKILRFDQAGETSVLGPGGWEAAYPNFPRTPAVPGRRRATPPEHITEEKPRIEPEEPLRSLGDMLEAFKREEVPV